MLAVRRLAVAGYTIPLLVMGYLVVLGYRHMPGEEVRRPPAPGVYVSEAFGPVPDRRTVETLRRTWMEEREKRRVKARGVYVSGRLAGTAKMDEIIDLIRRTELNAVVIDVKDDQGSITYDSRLPEVAEIGSRAAYIKDLDGLISCLEKEGIYSIARVVVFKDSTLAGKRPSWAVKTSGGQVYRDRIGSAWVNPYLREVWEYNLAVAREAASRGFREIQFDYVRFPSDGQAKGLAYEPGIEATGGEGTSPEETVAGGKSIVKDRIEVITGFLAYARRELEPYGVFVSADVFGLVTTAADDMGIGQRWEELAARLDYISPMLYPSHYRRMNYGLPDPDAAPYATVYRAMQDAVRRTAGTGAIIRPWLQDFSLRHPYGPREVRAEIQAAYDAGAEEWLLWNPYSNFSEGALLPATSKAASGGGK